MANIVLVCGCVCVCVDVGIVAARRLVVIVLVSTRGSRDAARAKGAGAKGAREEEAKREGIARAIARGVAFAATSRRHRTLDTPVVMQTVRCGGVEGEGACLLLPEGAWETGDGVSMGSVT